MSALYENSKSPIYTQCFRVSDRRARRKLHVYDAIYRLQMRRYGAFRTAETVDILRHLCDHLHGSPIQILVAYSYPCSEWSIPLSNFNSWLQDFTNVNTQRTAFTKISTFRSHILRARDVTASFPWLIDPQPFPAITQSSLEGTLSPPPYPHPHPE